MRARTDDYHDLPTTEEQEFQRHQAFHGFENVPGTYRLLLMNLSLHGLSPEHVELGDTLSPEGARMTPANVATLKPYCWPEESLIDVGADTVPIASTKSHRALLCGHAKTLPVWSNLGSSAGACHETSLRAISSASACGRS